MTVAMLSLSQKYTIIYLSNNSESEYLKLEAPRSLYSSPGYNNNISQ